MNWSASLYLPRSACPSCTKLYTFILSEALQNLLWQPIFKPSLIHIFHTVWSGPRCFGRICDELWTLNRRMSCIFCLRFLDCKRALRISLSSISWRVKAKMERIVVSSGGRGVSAPTRQHLLWRFLASEQFCLDKELLFSLSAVAKMKADEIYTSLASTTLQQM